MIEEQDGDIVSEESSRIISKKFDGHFDGMIKELGGSGTDAIRSFGGAAITTPSGNGKGTLSIIIEGLAKENYGKDYFNPKTNMFNSVSPGGREIVTGHELFGHGRTYARGAADQHINAIRMENLILRVMGFGEIRRNGTNHLGGNVVQDESKLPDYL